MATLKRIRIALDEDEYALAKSEAEALGISVAEFIRRAVRARLLVPSEGAWMKYAGSVESGDPRASQRLNELAYGGKG